MPHQIPDFFAKGLYNIGGPAPNGKPRLRIVHGTEATEMIEGKPVLRYAKRRELVFVGYEVIAGMREHYHGCPLTGRLVSRLEIEKVIVPEDMLGNRIGRPIVDFKYHGPQYWILEQYVPHHLYTIGWELNRYRREGGKKIDVLGPASAVEGYTFIARLAESDADGATPWELGEQTLAIITKWWHQTLNDPVFKKYSPNEKPTQEAYQLADKIEKEQIAEAEAKESEESYYIIRNAFTTAQKLIFNSRANAGGGAICGKNPQIYSSVRDGEAQR